MHGRRTASQSGFRTHKSQGGVDHVVKFKFIPVKFTAISLSTLSTHATQTFQTIAAWNVQRFTPK